MDGWIRIWFHETIDQVDIRDEERFLEIQPIYEYHISENDKAYESMLMCMRKREPDNPESTLWYVQVSNCLIENDIKYMRLDFNSTFN